MGIFSKSPNLVGTPTIRLHNGFIIIELWSKCSILAFAYGKAMVYGIYMHSICVCSLYISQKLQRHMYITCIWMCRHHKEEQQNWFTTQSLRSILVKCWPIGVCGDLDHLALRHFAPSSLAELTARETTWSAFHCCIKHSLCLCPGSKLKKWTSMYTQWSQSNYNYVRHMKWV